MKFVLTLSLILTGLLIALLVAPINSDGSNTFLLFLGRFHPLILHLPIGALIALFVIELINWIRPNHGLDRACEILLWICTLTAVPSVIAGYMLASSGGYSESLLSRHMWLGWGTTLLCAWLLVVRYWKRSKPAAIWLYRPLLFLNVILLSLAGHYGGSLTHGSDYLTKYMPVDMKQALGIEPTASEKLMAEIQNAEPESVDEDALFFVNHVQPVMSQYCYSCHGPDKQKGNIRLDELDFDMVNGPDAESWHTALDQINAGEMPPKGKAQPTDEERRLVVDWMTDSLEDAAKARRRVAQHTMRRLTRHQYANSLNELLGLSIDFHDVLPEDGKSEMGFSNDAETLQTSALHIEYFQKIAREALDKAIVEGDKPEVKRYKATIGLESGVGKPGGSFGGFQAVTVNPDHFEVHVLDEDSQVKQGKAAKDIQNSIGFCMRGSATDRFTITPEGMNLYSALPHKEFAPRSWQGPSPNLKMLIKHVYPGDGPFMLRVEASQGAFTPAAKEGFVSLRDKAPAKTTDDSIVIQAADHEETKNMELRDDGFLVPVDITSDSEAIYNVEIPESGFYQIDLEHPYVEQAAMPSFDIRLAWRYRKQERLQIDESLANDEAIVHPVSLAYLDKKKYHLKVGGSFFVGFRKITFTPLPKEDPAYQDLKKEAEVNAKKYEGLRPALKVFAGTRTDDGMDYKTFGGVRTVEAPTGEPQIYEFQGNFENLPVPAPGSNSSGHLADTMIIGLWNDYLVKKSSESGPPLMIHSLELEAPYYEQWPPKTHTQIFFESANQKNEEAYTKEVIQRFMERAFRRDVTEKEVGFYVDFWRQTRNEFDHYQDSVKEVLVAVLCSPNFLYIVDPEADEAAPAEESSEDFLASRLSYFLWNSPPDDELRELAATGNLQTSLNNQVDRMLRDPRVLEMIRAFSYEWLRIDRLKQMDTNVGKYPDFTRFVKQDMAEETYQLIHQVLQDDMSIMQLIDSDFAMLNQNLAEFYGVPGVKGSHFQKVTLPEGSNRGGLLTQGAFLNGHSDGMSSHPIKRAVWLKEKILGEKPPPPPPNVPELDPDTPGFEKLTLKEQLELHRDKASCVDCHLKIDPYGVVFENFDATGRFISKIKDRPVDAASVLPDGTEVEGIEGIKQYILEHRRDSFTKALVEHLYAYALGRNVSFADEEEIDTIVSAVRSDDYKFKSVIKHIVTSDSFTQ
ncbi:MAG: DUF1592 domain-containing protein [Verrucomicrobiota bacterium]